MIKGETARAQPKASTCERGHQESFTYTPEGALLTKKVGTSTTRYTYDLFGALRHVALPDGTDIDYVIDGTHRRIGKKLNGTLTSGYLYKNALSIVAEVDGNGSLVSQFVYGTQPYRTSCSAAEKRIGSCPTSTAACGSSWIMSHVNLATIFACGVCGY